MKINSLFSHACKLRAWVMLITIFVCGACSNDIKIISDFPINQKLNGHHIKALDSLYNAYSITKLEDKYLLTLQLLFTLNFTVNLHKYLNYIHYSNKYH